MEVEQVKSKKRDIKFYIKIAIFAAVALIYLGAWLQLNNHHSGDFVIYYLPTVQVLKESISAYNNPFPLWNPYYLGGTSYAGIAIGIWLNPILAPFLLTMTNVLGAMKLSVVASFFLSAIFMYLLAFHLLKNKNASLIAALIFAFNGYITNNLLHSGWLVYAYAYPITPLVALFALKATQSKKWLAYSVLTAAMLALQIWGGAGILFLYSSIAFGFILLFSLKPKRLVPTLTKVVCIGLVVVVFTFSFMAIKILPIQEFMEGSSRELTYEQTATRTVPWSNVWRAVIEPPIKMSGPQDGSDKIGLIAFALVLLALIYRWTNKKVLLFGSIAIMGIILANDNIIQWLFWKFYPGWKGMRYANRANFLFVFGASILAAYGFTQLLKIIEKKWKSTKWNELAFWAVFGLITINLLVLGAGPTRNPDSTYQFLNIGEMVDNNHLMQYVADQPGIFRTHVMETRGIDWGTEFYMVPLGIENLYGYISIWLPEYLNEYLSLANNNMPKFWGIMNVKYLTSRDDLTGSGITMIDKFPECLQCFPTIDPLKKAYGPYLYENDGFVPRAYIAKNAMLVVGNKESAKQVMYGLMLNTNFDPNNYVVVLSDGSLDAYTDEELSHFDAVFLTEGANFNSETNAFKLERYQNSGGLILPNVFEGVFNLGEEDINELYALVNESKVEVPDSAIKTIDFEHKTIQLPKQEGFLVLSEKYALFPGWNAFSSKEHRIHRANGVVTAIYLDGTEESVEFSYEPISFKRGKIISLIALILALIILGVSFKRKRKQVKSN